MSDTAMLGKPTYERLADDAYLTPEWCTQALVDKVKLRGVIWEPAFGEGHIARVLEANGYPVKLRSDIRGQISDEWCDEGDFLKAEVAGRPSLTIVTNPPYSHAEEFIRHALELTGRAGGMVAMLLRHEYDCAKSRRDLFESEPFAKQVVLTKRPRWVENTTGSPRHNYSWFIWDWHHKGPATKAYAP